MQTLLMPCGLASLFSAALADGVQDDALLDLPRAMIDVVDLLSLRAVSDFKLSGAKVMQIVQSSALLLVHLNQLEIIVRVSFDAVSDSASRSTTQQLLAATAAAYPSRALCDCMLMAGMVAFYRQQALPASCVDVLHEIRGGAIIFAFMLLTIATTSSLVSAALGADPYGKELCKLLENVCTDLIENLSESLLRRFVQQRTAPSTAARPATAGVSLQDVLDVVGTSRLLASVAPCAAFSTTCGVVLGLLEQLQSPREHSRAFIAVVPLAQRVAVICYNNNPAAGAAILDGSSPHAHAHLGVDLWEARLLMRFAVLQLLRRCLIGVDENSLSAGAPLQLRVGDV